MKYLYPVKLSRDEGGRYLAESRDVPEAIADADECRTAFTEMSRALGTALAGYALAGRPVPAPTVARAGEVMVPVEPLVAAKLVLLNAMRKSQVTNSELARRLAVTEAVVRRLVDPDHASRLDRVVAALQTLGAAVAIEEVHSDWEKLSSLAPG